MVLGAKDGFPAARQAKRLFRQACQNNPYVRWLPPREIVSSEARELPLPLSWTVALSSGRMVSITPDEILGFDVDGSISRLLLLSIDYGTLPVSDPVADSLLLRTEALVAARKREAVRDLCPAKVIVAWIMEDLKRLEELRRLCSERNYSDVCLIDEQTFFSFQDVLAIKWHMSDGPSHTLI